MIPDPEPKTVADLLVLLERGKIGYGYAMRFLGIDSLDELWETAAINGRRLPGHRASYVAPEIVDLLRALPRRSTPQPST